jgi:hypothetical protein
MSLNSFSAGNILKADHKVYSGSDVPTDVTGLFKKGDWYIRTDVASGAPWLYVATADGGTWKSVGNLA